MTRAGRLGNKKETGAPLTPSGGNGLCGDELNVVIRESSTTIPTNRSASSIPASPDAPDVEHTAATVAAQ